MKDHFPLTFLKQQFEKRTVINRSYSLHSYARDLKVSKSFLSRIFNGKRNITPRFASLIARHHSVDHAVLGQWLREIEDTSKHRKLEIKSTARSKIPNFDMEHFRAISCWHHLAILNLVEVKDFNKNTSWIADRLSITKKEANAAVNRLFKLGLLTEDRKGNWLSTHREFYVPTTRSHLAMRKFHSDMSDKAKAALSDSTTAGFHNRYIAGVTLSFERSKISILQKKVRNFQEQIIRLASANKLECSDVYHLNLQLFPLTTGKKYE